MIVKNIEMAIEVNQGQGEINVIALDTTMEYARIMESNCEVIPDVAKLPAFRDRRPFCMRWFCLFISHGISTEEIKFHFLLRHKLRLHRLYIVRGKLRGRGGRCTTNPLPTAAEN